MISSEDLKHVIYTCMQHTHRHIQCCIDRALELSKILVEHGADLNSRDVDGWTPLHAAAATGNIQMINMLVEGGASLVAINHNDKMPIDVSADSDIKYVLQQKMNEAGMTFVLFSEYVSYNSDCVETAVVVLCYHNYLQVTRKMFWGTFVSQWPRPCWLISRIMSETINL